MAQNDTQKDLGEWRSLGVIFLSSPLFAFFFNFTFYVHDGRAFGPSLSNRSAQNDAPDRTSHRVQFWVSKCVDSVIRLLRPIQWFAFCLFWVFTLHRPPSIHDPHKKLKFTLVVTNSLVSVPESFFSSTGSQVQVASSIIMDQFK